MATTTPSYNTIEELQHRKDELKVTLQDESQKMGKLWHQLTDPQPSNTKGEMVVNIISNCITAIDAFLLVRKLMKTYGNLFPKKKKEKK